MFLQSSITSLPHVMSVKKLIESYKKMYSFLGIVRMSVGLSLSWGFNIFAISSDELDYYSNTIWKNSLVPELVICHQLLLSPFQIKLLLATSQSNKTFNLREWQQMFMGVSSCTELKEWRELLTVMQVINEG